MTEQHFYVTTDCVDFVKRKYPFIPKWIIRRVLFAEDIYMKNIGIIDHEPSLNDW